MKDRRIIAMSMAVALLVLALPLIASATDPPQGFADGQYGMGKKIDDRSHPLGKQQRALHKIAMEEVIRGNAHGNTHEVAHGQFVELERTGEDLIWTVLGEFDDFPHNNIAEPDRSEDNSTIWRADFSQAHYDGMLYSEAPGFNSVRNFYIEQSSNRYAVGGDVTDWVPLPEDACDYDDGDDEDLWQILIDSTKGWYDAQIADGMTPDQINDYLSQFDVWDRYDWDGDGNFDEPDGYIDHFQSVHSGEGEEAGGGALGGCAIWSHRWYTYFNGIGVWGPSPEYLLGGIQIGESDFWIGDYTIEPENGGVGVFAHEFGHDLGLPDLYDTSGATNGTGFWTLMSSGSWLNGGTEDIGSKPGHMGVWEKFQLGWLNYEVAFAGSKSEHKLGPAETNTKQAQGLFVLLPDKEVVTQIAEPYSGEYFYYSDSGNDLDNFMVKTFTLVAGSTLSAQANVQVEVDWDYAYLIASSDGGATWTNVQTNLSTNYDPNGQNFGQGITGNSGGWTPLTADLSAYIGDMMLGFRYWTDGAAVEPGFMVDDIVITGYPLDGAETDVGWTFDGFRVTTGTETGFFFNAYVAAFRQYRGYDDGLDTGPYNFGWFGDPTLSNWVERFPYQNGLLISYWDGSQSNNNVGTHPGKGLILPIDAHPEAMERNSGGIWVGRVPTYDSTFGLEPTDAITLHRGGVPTSYPSLPAVSVFDDTTQYYNPDPDYPIDVWNGVINPQTGTQIRIKSVSAHGSFMQVEVRPSKNSRRVEPRSSETSTETQPRSSKN